jgi:hypothetical protein
LLPCLFSLPITLLGFLTVYPCVALINFVNAKLDGSALTGLAEPSLSQSAANIFLQVQSSPLPMLVRRRGSVRSMCA